MDLEPYRYAVWLLVTWFPLGLLAWWYWTELRSYVRIALIMALCLFPFGVAWDYFAMYKGIWFFLTPYSTPLILGHFPIEELILIFSVPIWSPIVYGFFKEVVKL